MAEIIWSVPALADLDAIADDIAIDNAPAAAAALVKWVLPQVEQLIEHPDSGSRPQDSSARAIARLSNHLAACSTAWMGSTLCWCT
ncbi:type II toxin-antitoxin system RelE/ParE family toxin [Xanthomonas euvesicatoria pv. eucalypti]|nr:MULTISPECIES: type II toxin-antitoxin system RelE/ParE family toxin [Xanthomonas]MDO7930543.1 type II toxin-antitoxin system RelE/ParE family toxin [Xanthomonas euvesicatoria pv. eucalypti]MDO7934781.1 type II toxin-antitoxin system RelE/ParE family toxin [Xanthomonas euvesicatoria pv. eucalypti]MDO7938923.1 type II toxin-antitoxin system RelE/ParE family toxin [Xanthomonas euvesicatoria pv. eucalypti]MDO7943129.1 type II toxin-antitoxin system RelE/ParE family toxin [Xanthomonas euvesicator